MRRTTTWWRDLGGLLAACVLALLVAAPMTGAAACLCNEDAVGQTTSVGGGQAIHANQPEDSGPCQEPCCLGGHCHHAGPALDVPVVVLASPAPRAAELTIAPARALASRAPSALDRPPRA